MDKKAFAKVITKIRKDMGTDSYPKAMMTSQQESKCTATVNCNIGYKDPGTSLDRAQTVITDPRFIELLVTYKATARIEPLPQTKNCYQIRIRW